MDGLWDDYWIDVSVSFGAAFFSAVAMRFKAWMRGELDQDAPPLRSFLAYLAAYLVAFAAIRGFEGLPRYFVIIAAAALAFGVTINGARPLASSSYARSVGIGLCGIFVLLGIYALLTALGCDVAPNVGSPRL